jgi:HSP20 family molecular chaperone IbpA
VNKINAKYENGVLVLNIEKKEEAKVKEPKTIVVE